MSLFAYHQSELPSVPEIAYVKRQACLLSPAHRTMLCCSMLPLVACSNLVTLSCPLFEYLEEEKSGRRTFVFTLFFVVRCSCMWLCMFSARYSVRAGVLQALVERHAFLAQGQIGVREAEHRPIES